MISFMGINIVLKKLCDSHFEKRKNLRVVDFEEATNQLDLKKAFY